MLLFAAFVVYEHYDDHSMQKKQDCATPLDVDLGEGKLVTNTLHIVHGLRYDIPHLYSNCLCNETRV